MVMKEDKLSRRDFIKSASLVAAGTMAGAQKLAGKTASPIKASPTVDTSKILNYNQNMRYRRLGKTDLQVSSICMGGHWKRIDVMKQDFDQNRHEVVSRCIDVGINYIDACWGGEVVAYSKALKGKRDKMYLALSNGSKEPRFPEYRTANKLLESLDELLLESKQEYTDLWRMTMLESGGKHTFNTSCEIALAMEKAKEQGKARFTGFSTHDRRWMEFMIKNFPQLDAICFPYTAMSKKAPSHSLFDTLAEYDVGFFGIKPFASNSLFKGNSAPGNPHEEEDNRRARLVLRYILASNADIHPIPGLISIAQVDNVVKAMMERTELDLEEKAELDTMTKDIKANLPPHYQWMNDWEYV